VVSCTFATAGVTVLPGSGVAAAATPGEQIIGELVADGGGVVVMNTDGSGRRKIPFDGWFGAVSPDGSMIAGEAGGWTPTPNHVWPVLTMRTDGSNPQYFVPDAGTYRAQDFSADGRTLYLSRDEYGDDLKGRWELYAMPADGTAAPRRLPGGANICSSGLSMSSVGSGAFLSFGTGSECSLWEASIHLFDERSGQTRQYWSQDGPVYAQSVDISPDGKRLAVVMTVSGPEGEQQELRIYDVANGSRITVGVQDQPSALGVDWSPNGKRLLLTDNDVVSILDPASGKETKVASAMRKARWLPAPTDAVTRVHGADAVRTAVAASRAKFANAGAVSGRKAKVAVLTRSDAFYDGLAGSGLAGAKGGPMLLTSPKGLDAAVAGELTRTLAPGATVYLLGGTSALGAGVESAVRARGFVPRRLSGAGFAETGIAIAREKSKAPTRVLVATAREYYDALAAGAAAGTQANTTVVLTWGATLPAATRAYLKALPATTSVVTVGGPAAAALKAGGLTPRAQLTGSDAADTAVRLAKYTFTAPATVALATTRTWQDALAGGALISGSGPLLLTDPGALSPPTAKYLAARSSYIGNAIILGGPSALGPKIVNATGAAISTPGRFRSVDSYNGTRPAPLG